MSTLSYKNTVAQGSKVREIEKQSKKQRTVSSVIGNLKSARFRQSNASLPGSFQQFPFMVLNDFSGKLVRIQANWTQQGEFDLTPYFDGEEYSDYNFNESSEYDENGKLWLGDVANPLIYKDNKKLTLYVNSSDGYTTELEVLLVFEEL